MNRHPERNVVESRDPFRKRSLHSAAASVGMTKKRPHSGTFLTGYAIFPIFTFVKSWRCPVRRV